MQYHDLFFGGMLINTLNKIETDNIVLNFLIAILPFIILNTLNKFNFNNLCEYLINFYNNRKESAKITFISKSEHQSERYRSLLHYLTKNCKEKNIKYLIEDINENNYDYWGNVVNSEKIYRVNQSSEFKFTDDIKGKIYVKEKEESGYNGKIFYKQMFNLDIYSDTKSLIFLQDFVEECVTEFKNYIKSNKLLFQTIIEVETNEKKSDEDLVKLVFHKRKWTSFKTFDNLFLPNKNEIVKSIDFFLNNRKWYEEKGLPWTLGILLSGIPGSGKTSFIKALLNYTNRHCIDVKLDEEFDINSLGKLLSYEEINDDLIIPIEKRIIVLEDIDAMGNIVKDRDILDKENLENYDSLCSKQISSSEVKKVCIDDNTNECLKNLIRKSKNNLSRLLNMIDGLSEDPGRIIVVTTNKPEKLDKAFKRPGRIDISINFSFARSNEISQVLAHFWGPLSNEDLKLIKVEYLEEFDGKFSIAQIMNFCRISDNIVESIQKMKLNLN